MTGPSSRVGFERILGPGDPRVADYRAIAEPELLRSQNLFVAEGRFVVERLLADPRWKVRSVLVNDAAARQLATALSAFPREIPVFVTGAPDFLGITGHHIHRGCLALVERPPTVGFDELMSTIHVGIVLEDVANADNIGGVFRNAAALGADAVMLSPRCCSPFYRKAVRTSMGAVLSVPFVHFGEWPAPLAELRRNGFTLVALVAGSLDPLTATLAEFASRPQPSKLALLVGSEGSGLRSASESAADVRVHIPMAPGVDSLNLAVATGIALEQLTRTSRRRGILPGRTDPDT
jgi:tRNA G18 (ribose-2'-O)-methylase SpoU